MNITDITVQNITGRVPGFQNPIEARKGFNEGMAQAANSYFTTIVLLFSVSVFYVIATAVLRRIDMEEEKRIKLLFKTERVFFSVQFIIVSYLFFLNFFPAVL